MQGGIGLPGREYYLSADPKMADTRTKYKAYVQTILQDAGYADPAGAAGRIMDLETKIAQAHEPREQSEDFANGAQVWTRQQLEQKAPGIDWGALLAPRGSAACRSSTPIISPRSRSSRRWSARSRCRTGRTGWRSTR